MMKKSKFTFDIIIATKNRLNEVVNCVESILLQSQLPKSIIIVDASDKEGLQNAVSTKLNKKIKFKYLKANPGLTSQRNVGIKHSRAELILFLDDDVVLSTDYLKEINDFFLADSDKEIGGITGKVLNVKKQALASKIIRKLFFLAEQKGGEVKNSWANNSFNININSPKNAGWLSGCNQCYKKDVFNNNKFDENLTLYSYMEDFDFSYRVSKEYGLIYLPSATIIHNHHAAQETRLKKIDKQKMFMINLHYLFKKNMESTFLNRFQHYWSYLGYIVRGLILERNLPFIIGTLIGIYLNIFNKNDLVKGMK